MEYLSLVMLVVLFTGSSGKQIYSDLLSNDNELIPLQLVKQDTKTTSKSECSSDEMLNLKLKIAELVYGLGESETSTEILKSELSDLITSIYPQLNNNCLDVYVNGSRITWTQVQLSIKSIKPKCIQLRSGSNELKRIYMKELNSKLINETKKMKIVSHVPICDSDGYFEPIQCDLQVNCWCVDKFGNLIAKTAHSIRQAPVDCGSMISISK